jgi:hypothetical protein
MKESNKNMKIVKAFAFVEGVTEAANYELRGWDVEIDDAVNGVFYAELLIDKTHSEMSEDDAMLIGGDDLVEMENGEVRRFWDDELVTAA